MGVSKMGAVRCSRAGRIGHRRSARPRQRGMRADDRTGAPTRTSCIDEREVRPGGVRSGSRHIRALPRAQGGHADPRCPATRGRSDRGQTRQRGVLCRRAECSAAGGRALAVRHPPGQVGRVVGSRYPPRRPVQTGRHVRYWPRWRWSWTTPLPTILPAPLPALSAARAAFHPHAPWTPPPGWADAEAR